MARTVGKALAAATGERQRRPSEGERRAMNEGTHEPVTSELHRRAHGRPEPRWDAGLVFRVLVLPRACRDDPLCVATTQGQTSAHGRIGPSWSHAASIAHTVLWTRPLSHVASSTVVWQNGGFCITCIGQGHGAHVPDESYADHPTAPDADAIISPCIDASVSPPVVCNMLLPLTGVMQKPTRQRGCHPRP